MFGWGEGNTIFLESILAPPILGDLVEKEYVCIYNFL